MSSGSSFFINGGGTILSIAANTAVTWKNDSGVDHDVTFDDPTTALAVGTGASGNIPAPATGPSSRQFAVSGSTHPFHCTIHGSIMHGTVTVM
jgi:plastocyanin